MRRYYRIGFSWAIVTFIALPGCASSSPDLAGANANALNGIKAGDHVEVAYEAGRDVPFNPALDPAYNPKNGITTAALVGAANPAKQAEYGDSRAQLAVISVAPADVVIVLHKHGYQPTEFNGFRLTDLDQTKVTQPKVKVNPHVLQVFPAFTQQNVFVQGNRIYVRFGATDPHKWVNFDEGDTVELTW